MRIVGIENEPETGAIHTIDVWFSERRSRWIVERLDADGNHLGAAHVCADRDEAEDCLADWMRTHGETHLVSPYDDKNRLRMPRAA